MDGWMVDHEVLLGMHTGYEGKVGNAGAGLRLGGSDKQPGLDQVSDEVVSAWKRLREVHGVLRVRPREERSRIEVAGVTCH